MKNIVLLLAILHTGVLHAQQPWSKDQLDVQKIVVDAFTTLSDKDAEGLRKLCTADAMFYEYGEAWPVDTLIDLAITQNTAADFTRTNKLNFVNTTIQGNTAWTTYYLQSDFIHQDESSSVYWMETVILVHEENQWKIAVLHSTRIDKNKGQ